jgi:hypothetical protein
MKKLLILLLLSLPAFADLQVGQKARIQSVSSSYTVTNFDDLILVDATSGSKTVTLPDATLAANKGKIVTIKKVDSSANAVLVSPVASQLIDGSSSYSIAPQYGVVTLVSTGSAWTIKDQKAFPGSVTSNTSGLERVERVRVASSCTSTPCTITDQSGSWVSSISRISLGQYTVNFAAGEFSGAPTCFLNMSTTNCAGSTCGNGYVTSVSTSSALIVIQSSNNTAFLDSAFGLLCMGPR